jgi:type I restriction-modification system DNA methylase subunit
MHRGSDDMNEHELKKELIDLLKSFPGQFNEWQVFFDWVHAVAYAYSNQVDIGKHWQERENAYLKLVKKYGKEEFSKFPKAHALLIKLFEHKIHDWLGDIYMEGGFSSKGLGQFFTPYHLSYAMTKLTFSSELKDLIKENGKIKVNEPSVGAGGMMLALAAVMSDEGFNPQTELEIYCNDLDQNALLMAYVQLNVLGIPAICEVKDTLAPLDEPPLSRWKTIGWVLFRHKKVKPDVPVEILSDQRKLDQYSIEDIKENGKKLEQLTLEI